MRRGAVCYDPPPDVIASIHAPAWGATRISLISMDWRPFQSTHPRGVRLEATDEQDKHTSFNPRTRVGCDATRKKELICYQMFQSTHPRGVRLQLRGKFDLLHQFQSTHPRGVRLYITYFDICASQVSIHAPAWGATIIFSRTGCGRKFQSTHPRGVRLYITYFDICASQVSIHAPAWGATF